MLGQQIFINKLGEQVFDLGRFCVVNVVDHVCKPGVWVNIVVFAGGKEGVKHTDVSGCGV